MKFQNAVASSFPTSGLALESTLLALYDEFNSFSDGGLQVAYYDTDTFIVDGTGIVIMGVTGVPGNAKALVCDASGHLVVDVSSFPSGFNVDIVSPLDGSGNVKVAVENTVPTNATIISPLDGSGNVKVAVENTVPVSGAVNASIVSPVDGSGYVEVDVKTIVTANVDILSPLDGSGNVKVAVENTVPVSGAVNASIVSPVDGSGYVEVDVKTIVTANVDIASPLDGSGNVKVAQQYVIAAPGSAVPAQGVAIGGSDGTDLRFVSLDSLGRVNINTVAGTVAVRTAAGVTLGVVDSADGTPGSAPPTLAMQVAGTDSTDLRALLTDATGQLKVLIENSPAVTISGQPIEIKGGSTTSASVYPVGGSSQAVVTVSATTITAFVSAPSAGTAYRLISVTVIGTGNAASTAFWKIGNSAMTAAIAGGNVVPQTVLLNGQLWLPAYGAIDAQISASTPNILFTLYYDVITTPVIT